MTSHFFYHFEFLYPEVENRTIFSQRYWARKCSKTFERIYSSWQSSSFLLRYFLLLLLIFLYHLFSLQLLVYFFDEISQSHQALNIHETHSTSITLTLFTSQRVSTPPDFLGSLGCILYLYYMQKTTYYIWVKKNKR